MEQLQDYRDPENIMVMVSKIKEHNNGDKVWNIMEVCGGQTHSIVRNGLDQILEGQINFIHGPGCPVCVTPLESIDLACSLAKDPNTILCSFGDMLRVPGSESDLLSLKSRGSDIRMVYSPMDAVKLAQQEPKRRIIFFAIGFETTAPSNAFAVLKAKEWGLSNFSVLCSHMLAPPAISYILSQPGHQIDGILAPGHVCTITGLKDYQNLVSSFDIPIAATGFEALEILSAVHLLSQLLKEQKAKLVNAYPRSVSANGNQKATRLMDAVFRVCDQNWRGIGFISNSGLCLKPEYAEFDAAKRWGEEQEAKPCQAGVCISGQILLGVKKPGECPSFGTKCTPQNPIGATMVSSEGACAAYYDYRH